MALSTSKTLALCAALGLLCACGAFASGRGAAPEGLRPWRSPGTAGNVFTFRTDMPQLGAKGRRVWVYLPPDYDSSSKRYPVLYMLDGQNLFDPAESFAGEWKVDEALEKLFAEGRTAGVIVVGVDNGGATRIDEYTPWRNEEYKAGGKADKTLAFLADTLKPLVDSRLRTLPGRENTAVAGSSLGGLFSLYAVLERPDVFSRAGVFSPALWFNRKEIFGLMRSAGAGGPARFYVDAGSAEGEKPEVYAGDAREAAAALKARPGAAVSLVIEEGAGHNEAAWARRFPEAFLWLFR